MKNPLEIIQKKPYHRFSIQVCAMLFDICGEVPEWLKGTDCKSVDLYLRRFESCPRHQGPHLI
jgi:hypothetical protein